jgi:hypothetical protein
VLKLYIAEKIWVYRSSSVSKSSMCFLAESDKEDFGGVNAAMQNHFEQRLAYLSFQISV